MNIISKVHNVDPRNSDSRMLLLIDSGACLSVCPRAWCSWLPTRPTMNTPQAVTATGKPLVFYGIRTVPRATWANVQLNLEFYVADVTQPIVAVADLQAKEILPDFGEHPALIYGEERGALAFGEARTTSLLAGASESASR